MEIELEQLIKDEKLKILKIGSYYLSATDTGITAISEDEKIGIFVPVATTAINSIFKTTFTNKSLLIKKVNKKIQKINVAKLQQLYELLPHYKVNARANIRKIKVDKGFPGKLIADGGMLRFEYGQDSAVIGLAENTDYKAEVKVSAWHLKKILTSLTDCEINIGTNIPVRFAVPINTKEKMYIWLAPWEIIK